MHIQQIGRVELKRAGGLREREEKIRAKEVKLNGGKVRAKL